MSLNWFLSLPGDSDIVSQHPSNARAFRQMVHDAFNAEHDADTTGRHTIPSGDITFRDSLTWPDTGSLYISNADLAASSAFLQLHFRTGSVWYRVGEFVAGTKAVFSQAAAPTGWTQTGDNDRLMRVVSGAGGGTGGAWAISGLSTETANHTHNVVGVTGGENQTHYHGVSGNTGGPSGNSNCLGPAGGCLSSSTTHFHAFAVNSGTESAAHDHNINFASSGISATHTHTGDGTWRPAYIDSIIATKN